jgi:Flp pilus assembly protein TadG
VNRRRRSEAGAAALVVAVMLPLVFLACAAFAIDVSRWYLERQQLQVAADAAALAAVPYMPYDLVAATTRAREVAARNGFSDAATNIEVAVTEGAKPAQLRVVITAEIDNTFGAMIGSDSAVLSAVATADYQGPAPMGSPCNTFGNEPPSGGGLSSPQPTGTARGAAPLPNCTTQPQLWAMAEGPQTGKVQGDRYQTRGCESTGVDGCTSGKINTEYDEFGHVFLVKVEQPAVNHPIDVQLYDPMFVNTGQTCAQLPSSNSFVNLPTPTNLYVNDSDARNRYARNGTTSAQFCSGDSFPGVLPSGNTLPSRVVTSFVMRQQTDSQEPRDAPVQTDLGGSPCIRQYGGYSPTRSNGEFNTISATVFQLLSLGNYIPELGETFHNWTSFCRFTPTRAGDYYLQVRTNVSMGGSGSTYIKSGNSAAAALTGNTTTGAGANSFAIRAVTDAGLETSVAVSGYDHMPIYVNAPSAVSTFNLLRVLPGAAGRRISFEFFDAADAASGSGGTVQVIMPTEATYTGQPFPGGCLSSGGGAGSGKVLTNCIAPVSSATNNGKVQRMTIPIPNDYMCAAASLGGCWYRVTLSFPGVAVTDVTTWDAEILGDPVRLIE